MSDRFNSFLSGRFSQQQQADPRQGVNVRVPDEAELEVQKAEQQRQAEESEMAKEELKNAISSLSAQVEELKSEIALMRQKSAETPDLSAFVTTREQIRSLTNAIERQNVEISNTALVNSMEQIAIMREDFFKLCAGMEKRIDTMSAKDVLASFQAYEVDMENILMDGGVFIGHFPYESLNTLHQRIVEVVPTNDQEKNGLIAERLSDGYKLGNRVLLKEKVSVYKYVENMVQETPSEQPAEAAETVPAEPAPVEETPAAEPVEKPSEEAPAKKAPAKPVKKTSSRKRTSKKNTIKEEEE
jgi:molecular chaperone GrpE (heat shock protein)